MGEPTGCPRPAFRALRGAVDALPAVDPMPPHATGPIPWLGAGLGLLRDPTAHLTKLRARLGDTFVLDGLGYRLFFVFSPAGVRALYAAPEEQASRKRRLLKGPKEFRDMRKDYK